MNRNSNSNTKRNRVHNKRINTRIINIKSSSYISRIMHSGVMRLRGIMARLSAYSNINRTHNVNMHC